MEVAPPEGMPVGQWLDATFGDGGKKAYDAICAQFPSLKGGPSATPPRVRASVGGKEFRSHAQFVQGHGARRYIACSAPAAATVRDFYAMCDQEKVGSILQLNRYEIEKAGPNANAFQYCPVEAGVEMVFGPWRVRCLSSELKHTGKEVGGSQAVGGQKVMCRVSRLSVVGPTNNPREMIHVAHCNWPDGLIPQPVNEDNKVEENAHQLYYLMYNYLGKGPDTVLVHCKAGVGRTGTAIAMEICAMRLLDRARADVKETVETVRMQRPGAVATVWQYLYLNIALGRLVIERMDKSHYPAVFKRVKHLENAIKDCWKETTKMMPELGE